MLACSIYIMGTRKFLPNEGKVGEKFKRMAFKDAVASLKKNYKVPSPPVNLPYSEDSSTASSSPSSPSTPQPSSSPFIANAPAASGIEERGDQKGTGYHKAEFLHSHFYVNIYDAAEKYALDELWLRPIIQIGEVVSGDEKVFHFTAHHMNTRAIPQKKEVSAFPQH